MTSQINSPIGFIVSWQVPAIVTLGDLRNGITVAGLDAMELVPDLQPRSLVSRSAAFIAQNSSTKDVKKLSRPIAATVRQITREEASPGALAYTREAGIAYDEVSKRLTTDDATIGAILQGTAQHIDETRTAGDVTRVLQRIVSMAGSDLIPVREQGGAYFIPVGTGVIDQLASVLSEVGGTLTRFACTIGHGSDASVATVITDYMLKQIGELKQAVEELNEKGIRADVKSRRITRVAELRERIYAYQTLVGAQAETLTKALDDAETVLLAKLGMDLEVAPLTVADVETQLDLEVEDEGTEAPEAPVTEVAPETPGFDGWTAAKSWSPSFGGVADNG